MKARCDLNTDAAARQCFSSLAEARVRVCVLNLCKNCDPEVYLYSSGVIPTFRH